MVDDQCYCMGWCKKHRYQCRFVNWQDGVVLTKHVTKKQVEFLACQGCRTGLGDDLLVINKQVAARKRQRETEFGQLDMFSEGN